MNGRPTLADELEIRGARLEDMDAVGAIGRETYVEHFSDIWSAPALERFLERDFSAEMLADSLASPDDCLWILASEPQGETVGFAKVLWSRPNAIDGVVGAELQKIYFRTSAAGRGYGTKLLEYIVARATERRERRIWLDVLKSNTGARRFYDRHGFSVLGEIPYRTDLCEIGMTVMARELQT